MAVRSGDSPPSSRRLQGESAYAAAQARLQIAGDRDAILDAFFEYAQELFKFTVLFVVKGEVAHGRRVAGLGAPEGLVARLVFPFAQGGILRRAWEYKRAFVASPAADGEDAALIGMLGRAMPVAVVAPVVVGGRVVAILLGEGPKRFEDEGPAVTDATLMELARERMFAWTDLAGDAFERLIVRRKGDDGSVVASLRRPTRTPEPTSLALPSPSSSRPAAPSGSPSSLPRWVLPLALLGAAAIAAWLFVPRSQPDPNALAVRRDALPGWPSEVDPLTALEAASRAVAGEGAELVGIRAHLVRGAKVDAGLDVEGGALAFSFATELESLELRADADGLRGPSRSPRGSCGGRPCGRVVGAPKCAGDRLWAAATQLGVRDDDRLRATFSGGEAGAEWSLAIPERGAVVLDDATCRPRSRERFRPPPVPLAAIPGAPSAVDPIAALSLARTQSGLGDDAVLLEIDAKGVGGDGTVDLTRPDASITYRFSEPDSLPIAERRWRQVTIGPEGMPVTSIKNDREPLPTRVKGTVAPPRCTFGQVWALGLFPKDARARVLYGAEADGSEAGRWWLEAPSLRDRIVHADLTCVDGPAPPAAPQ